MVAIIGVASCALILTKSFLSPSGYLSYDSASYLGVAENILLGNGLFVSNEGRFDAHQEYFAIQPIGYPLMIYAVAELFDISTFLASKLLNVSFFLGCMAVISTSFGRNGPILALVMAFGGTLQIFSYTWSEVPFIFSLICFSALTANVLLPNSGSYNLQIISLFAFGVLGCCRFRGHRVRCQHGTGGGSWNDGSLRESSSLRRYG